MPRSTPGTRCSRTTCSGCPGAIGAGAGPWRRRGNGGPIAGCLSRRSPRGSAANGARREAGWIKPARVDERACIEAPVALARHGSASTELLRPTSRTPTARARRTNRRARAGKIHRRSSNMNGRAENVVGKSAAATGCCGSGLWKIPVLVRDTLSSSGRPRHRGPVTSTRWTTAESSTQRTPARMDARARERGLTPRGTGPAGERGAYIDPQTGRQRGLSHPNVSPPHGPVTNPAGQRIDINGNVAPPESPAARLPLRGG
jgi:hypothetical protein